MIGKFFSISLFAVAIAILAFGTFIEIDRQVVARSDYIFVTGFIGIAALIVFGILSLISYLLWRCED